MSRFCRFALLALPAGLPAAEPPAPLKIHVIGVGEYKPVESLTLFKNTIEAKYRVGCTTSFGKRGKRPLPNLEQLKSAEVMVIFARRTKLPEQRKAAIEERLRKLSPALRLKFEK